MVICEKAKRCKHKDECEHSKNHEPEVLFVRGVYNFYCSGGTRICDFTEKRVGCIEVKDE